jgi:hypothetical protein
VLPAGQEKLSSSVLALSSVAQPLSLPPLLSAQLDGSGCAQALSALGAAGSGVDQLPWST